MSIALRSATITQPTPAKREALARAEVGDDVFGDDPTVARLEARGAEFLGKEAAVFTPSGTMANWTVPTQMTIPSATSLRHLGALVCACLAITMNADAASEKILFDFQTATNSTAWQVVNDDVMGGISTSRFQILTNGGAVFSGVVSLENNGGFASVRSSPVRESLSGADAFVLRVRGDGRRYKFTVRTESGFDAPNYQAEFTTKPGAWEERRLSFKDFVPTFRGRVLTHVSPLNPAKLATVGVLIADKQAGPFRLEMGWIKAAGLPR